MHAEAEGWDAAFSKKCITWQPLSATAMNDLNGSLYYKLVVAFSFS